MINNATIAVSVTGNTLENPELPVRLGGGILIFGASWNGIGTYTVSNNSILRNRQGGAIHMNKGSGTATMSGSVTNNTIGTTGVNKSGSIEAFGIVIGARGAGGTHTTLVEDNSIFGWNDRAIVLANGEGNSTLNATVRGNTANTFDPINGLHGLHVDLGILAADAGSVCLDAGGAVAADRNHLTLAGNEPAGGVDLRVRRASAVNLRMPGYAGGADDDAAVTSVPHWTQRRDHQRRSPAPGPARTLAEAPARCPEVRGDSQCDYANASKPSRDGFSTAISCVAVDRGAAHARVSASSWSPDVTTRDVRGSEDVFKSSP